ncbi:MAG: TetR/AcrR family transcriptional regulator [Chloroflexota bacterium]
MDRRFLRTERMLTDAMLALIQEKPLADITVQDIVARADIAKKTFYSHYENKLELLWRSLESHFQALETATNPLNPGTLLMNNKPLTYPVFVHVAEFETFYRSILVTASTDSRLITQFLDYLAAQSYKRHQPIRDLAPQMTVPPELISHLLSGAVVGTLRWWLKNDLADSPEEMAYRFSQIVAPGVLQSMGLE